MTGIVIIGAIVAGVLLYAASKDNSVNGMTNAIVSLENIRNGVANGWYTCTLTYVNGTPAVFLSGRTMNGKMFADVYPITQADYNTLKADGYAEDLELYTDDLPYIEQ